MKVRIDDGLCDGFGICASHCPEVFKLDEWGYAIVDDNSVVPEGREEAVRRALLDCPVHAIIGDD